MTLRLVFAAVLAVSTTWQAFSACVTDGGYAAQGTACVSDCFSFPLTTEIPYIGLNTPPTAPVESNNETFCTTVRFEEYDPNTAPGRKDWGFCHCSDGNSSLEEVWLADGGGVGLTHPENLDENGYQDCVLPFTYIDQEGNELSVTKCADINELPPFLGSGNDFPYPPLNSSTNTSFWCSINSDVYEVDPPSESIKDRKDWGYCLLSLRSVSVGEDNDNATGVDNSTEVPTLAPTFDDYYGDDDNETDANVTYSPTPFTTKPPTSDANTVKVAYLAITLLCGIFTLLLA